MPLGNPTGRVCSLKPGLYLAVFYVLINVPNYKDNKIHVSIVQILIIYIRVGS